IAMRHIRFLPRYETSMRRGLSLRSLMAAAVPCSTAGLIGPDGSLDESAHVYKTLILDQAGRPITRHQIWLTNINAYDNPINARLSGVVRYLVRVPAGLETKTLGKLKLTARVNYRRLNQDYIGYVLNQRRARMTVPIVAMAESTVTIGTDGNPAVSKADTPA